MNDSKREAIRELNGQEIKLVAGGYLGTYQGACPKPKETGGSGGYEPILHIDHTHR